VMRLPRCCPRICLTAIAFVFLSALDAAGVTGLRLRVYLRVSSGGKVDRPVSTPASAALLFCSLRLARSAINTSSASSLYLP
jgi:hypothetical protein